MAGAAPAEASRARPLAILAILAAASRRPSSCGLRLWQDDTELTATLPLEQLVDRWLLDGDNPFDPAIDLDALVPGALPPLDLARLVWAPALAARREER